MSGVRDNTTVSYETFPLLVVGEVERTLRSSVLDHSRGFGQTSYHSFCRINQFILNVLFLTVETMLSSS